MTKEAARQMLHKLSDEGTVQSMTKSVGVGRPQKVWELTDKAQHLFPDTHGELTVQIIQHIKGIFGESGLNKIVAAREAATNEQYRKKVPTEDSLETKIEKLVQIRSDEGYMARWEKTDYGYLLIEDHCPICAAATMCQGFCKAELNTFQMILGPEVTIKRTDHMFLELVVAPMRLPLLQFLSKNRKSETQQTSHHFYISFAIRTLGLRN